MNAASGKGSICPAGQQSPVRSPYPVTPRPRDGGGTCIAARLAGQSVTRVGRLDNATGGIPRGIIGRVAPAPAYVSS